MLYHQLMMFYEQMSQSAVTIRRKRHTLVLAFMFQSTSVTRLVCRMMQCLVSWDMHQISPSPDDVLSILTCACIGVMHICALYWNLGTYVVVPV